MKNFIAAFILTFLFMGVEIIGFADQHKRPELNEEQKKAMHDCLVGKLGEKNLPPRPGEGKKPDATQEAAMKACHETVLGKKH